MSHLAAKFGFIRNNLVLKIMLAVILLTWLPSIVILEYSTYVTKQSFLAYTSEYFTQSLNNYATAIDQKLFNLQADISSLTLDSGTLDILQQKKTPNTSNLKDKLSSIESSSNWQSLYVIDNSGKIIAASNDQQKVGQSLFAVDKNGSIFQQLKLSGQTIADGQTPAEDQPGTVSVLKPVITGGKIIGYVAGNYSLSGLDSLLNISASDNIHIYNSQSARVSIINANSTANKVIDHRSIDKAFVSNQSSSQTKVINIGQDIEVTVLPSFGSGTIANLHWRIVGSINTQMILKNIYAFRLKVYIVTFVSLAFVDIFLILFLTGLITKPLSKLKKVAQAIAAGNYQARAEASNRSDVIGRLQYAINDMAMTLINEHYNLERQVKAQTLDLNTKVIDLEKSKKAMANILKDLSLTKTDLELSKNKDDALLSSIGDGVFAIDRNERIILFNEAASNITGYTYKEVAGKKFSDILHFDVRSSGDNKLSFINKALSGKAGKMPRMTYIQHKHGHWIPVADSSSPVLEKSKVTGAIIVFRDITKELEIETTKNEFVSLASHQLRTPLTAIGWYTELLLKDQHRLLSKEQKAYLKEVRDGNKRMTELVNALLNLSRLELGAVEIEPKVIDIGEIVSSVESELSRQITTKSQSFKQEISADLPKIKSDPQLLRIIIQNLVTNAVKYTPNKGKILLSVEHIKTAKSIAGHKVLANRILISVKDNGYGIPQKEHAKIFTKLYRASNIKIKNTDGTGLGMYIVKLLCAILKGKIWFESTEDKGSTFYVTIPVNAKLSRAGTKQLEVSS